MKEKRTTWLPQWTLVGLMILFPARHSYPLGACVEIGDCDAGGRITIDELVKGVNILRGADLTLCPAFDCSRAPDLHHCVREAVRGALDRATLGVSGNAHVDVGGFELNVRCLGSGAPTVVLDAGRGDTLDVWVAVQPVVAGFTRVCSFDRAGNGASDPGPFPRTSAQIVTEMHALLQNGCLQPPYILTGHSFGGLDIHLYASNYPDEVAGLVFIDGRPSGFYDGLMALQPPLPPEIAAIYLSCSGITQPAGFSECTNVAESEAEVAAAAPLPHVPMTVFVSGQSDAGLPPEVAEQMDALWLRLQTELADSVPGSVLTVIDCPHYIHLCRPDLINATVNDMVAVFRAPPLSLP